MEKAQILSANFLDILFDGRNKAYGAYELRNTYNRRLVKALGATGLIIAVFMGATALKATGPEKTLTPVVGPTIEITKIAEPEKAAPPAPKPPKTQEPRKIETTKFMIPKITPDEKVITPPPSQNDLADVRIGIENIKGDKLGDIATPPMGVPDGKGLIETKQVDNDDSRFTKIEKEAEYSGDWARFLTTNLRSGIPVDNGAAPGNYQVLVQFVVDINGVVSDIKVIRDPGYGMAEEAIRVLKKSGKWKPAIQNGIPVKAYRKQPITFQVVEQ